MAKDNVNSPEHYALSQIECIDAMKEAYGQAAVVTYCELNAFKYIWRMHRKEKPVEDKKKAIWYLRYSIGDDPRKSDE